MSHAPMNSSNKHCVSQQMLGACVGQVLSPRLAECSMLHLQGCFVKPSKLAELQMEAALNSECQDASSPMISGGSSESIFN